jgi:hypothetical protein
MVFTTEMGTMLIEREIRAWTSRYIYSIHVTHSSDDLQRFTVVFSRPSAAAPIPGVVVRVHFEIANLTQPAVTYRIEGQRWVRQAEFTSFDERWLDRAMEQKEVLNGAMGPTPSQCCGLA